MRTLIAFCLVLIATISLGQNMRLESVHFVGSDPYDIYTVKVDSVFFNYIALDNSNEVIMKYKVQYKDDGSFFVNGNDTIYIFNNDAVKDEQIYNNLVFDISRKLKGRRSIGMAYGGPSESIEVCFLVDKAGGVLEKCLFFIGEEHSEIRKKFNNADFNFKPYHFDDNPVCMLYIISIGL